jgi:hypothetical protein
MNFLCAKRSSFLLLLLLAVLLTSGVARAEECVEPARRVEEIRAVIKEDARAARKWALTWGSIWGGATAIQAGLAATTHKREYRIDFTVGAIASAFGLLPTVVVRPAVIGNEGKLEELASDSSKSGCARLSGAEQILQSTADDERLRSNWTAHAGNVAFNALVASVLGFGYGRWVTALASALVGIPAGEAMILTQANGARDFEEKSGNARVSLVPRDDALEIRLGFAL